MTRELYSCFIHGDHNGEECPACEFAGKPRQRDIARRCGLLAGVIVNAKTGGPKSHFFSRERVDEIVLLLREAEKFILEGR